MRTAWRSLAEAAREAADSLLEAAKALSSSATCAASVVLEGHIVQAVYIKE